MFSKASAQTNYTLVTNITTVTITNTVTVTNVVAPPPALTNAPAKFPWVSSISLGLTMTKGNSDTLLFTAKFLTDKKTPDNEYIFDVDGAYGENDSVENVETLHGSAQWNHLFSDKLYGYLRAEGLHDGIADLDYRVTVGPGIGYYLLKEKQTTFSTEGGVSYVYQKLGGEDDSYASLRLAEKFEHKFNYHGVRFWESAEYLPEVDRFQNYLINGEVGIESALSKNLNLQVYVDDNFNSEPAAGRKRNDIKLVSAVSYNF
ncbi:MAG TPA: DUF481 domain-containing protein [Verrucomicrobiae bacterium]|nr:DUF481 domain-containing protein [Verrucomicrobiae bacterium]